MGRRLTLQIYADKAWVVKKVCDCWHGAIFSQAGRRLTTDIESQIIIYVAFVYCREYREDKKYNSMRVCPSADCDRAGVDRQSQRRSFQFPNLLRCWPVS